MKKLKNIILLGTVILSLSSCKKYLDVNKNPNDPTDATPELVLPQAIVTTSNTMNQYDSFGGWVGGYRANAGGYGGWGVVWTYNYTNTDYTGIWTSSFSAFNQLNFVIKNTTSDGPMKYHNGMARIMKAFLYAKLVDQYGDVPYSETGKGLENLAPKYDSYVDVYKALYKDLDDAIAVMKSAPVTNQTVTVSAGQDPFGGGSDATGRNKWTQFAETVKLRMLMRAKNVAALSSWVTTAKASLPTAANAYLTSDAIVNPGFSATTASQMNAKWNTYAYTSSNGSAGTGLSQLPTRWIVSFYDGGKLNDVNRGKAVYRSFGVNVSQTIGGAPVSFTGPSRNQLGHDAEPVYRSANGSYWLSGIGRSGVPAAAAGHAANDMGGVLKGATMGNVLMTLSEAKFLLAEASLASVNLLPSLAGNTQALFEEGILASYQYLYRVADNSKYINRVLTPSPIAYTETEIADMVTKYKADNPTSKLVNFNLAVSDAEKLEAIITQKYIAVNFINCDEGFNEYRRTGFPKNVNGSTDPIESFASLKSGAPAADRLPTRIQYPSVEFQVNAENVPKNVNVYTTKIFYAR